MAGDDERGEPVEHAQNQRPKQEEFQMLRAQARQPPPRASHGEAQGGGREADPDRKAQRRRAPGGRDPRHRRDHAKGGPGRQQQQPAAQRPDGAVEAAFALIDRGGEAAKDAREPTERVAARRHVVHRDVVGPERPVIDDPRRARHRLDPAPIGRVPRPPPPAGDRGVEPRPENRRLEVLRQKIDGAEPQRPRDVFGRIVQPGDDDDRRIAQGRIGAHGLENGVAVHPLHHDIQKHDVERPALEHVERRRAVRRRFDVVAKRADREAQLRRAHAAVVNDQNPRPICGERHVHQRNGRLDAADFAASGRRRDPAPRQTRAPIPPSMAWVCVAARACAPPAGDRLRGLIGDRMFQASPPPLEIWRNCSRIVCHARPPHPGAVFVWLKLRSPRDGNRFLASSVCAARRRIRRRQTAANRAAPRRCLIGATTAASPLRRISPPRSARTARR